MLEFLKIALFCSTYPSDRIHKIRTERDIDLIFFFKIVKLNLAHTLHSSHTQSTPRKNGFRKTRGGAYQAPPALVGLNYHKISTDDVIVHLIK